MIPDTNPAYILNRQSKLQNDTMKQYKFTLDPTSRKHRCPACGQKTFVRMVDNSTGEYAPEEYGRCDRESRCGYYERPMQEGERPLQQRRWDPLPAVSSPKTYYIPLAQVETSRKLDSYFHTWLTKMLGESRASEILGRYHVGASFKKWDKATVFFSVDFDGNPRRGKVMVYDPETGKRVKDGDGRPLISSIHAILRKADQKPAPCFFGEHLLKDDSKPAAIVESEKTALISAAHLPGFVWLACDGVGGISRSKFDVLEGRQVVLFPDAGCYDKWCQKALELNMPNVRVSRYLEDVGAAEGSDIADYLTISGIELSPKYRVINILESLEKAIICNNCTAVNNSCDSLEAIGIENISDDLFIKHAPVAYNILTNEIDFKQQKII